MAARPWPRKGTVEPSLLIVHHIVNYADKCLLCQSESVRALCMAAEGGCHKQTTILGQRLAAMEQPISDAIWCLKESGKRSSSEDQNLYTIPIVNKPGLPPAAL